jgi:hypothetical protein
MTIINPAKKRSRLVSPLMLSGIAAVICLAALNILMYHKNVTIEQAMKAQSASFATERLANTEMKQRLYQQFDAGNIERLVAASGFSKITAPNYLAAR